MGNIPKGSRSELAGKLGQARSGFVVIDGKLAPVSVAQFIEDWGGELVLALVKSLEKKKKNASGKLSDSIQYELKYFGDFFQFTLNMDDYWAYVDKGRKAGSMPPTAPIIKWLGYQSVKSKRPFANGLTMVQKRQMAYAIARNIGKKGIKPSNFYSNVVNQKLLDKFKRDIKEKFKIDVQIEMKSFADKLKGK